MSASIESVLQELGTAGAVAQAYSTGGLSIQVKTNYTPALTVYDELTASQPGFLSGVLGLQGGVRVLDASGNIVAQLGPWPDTDPVRVAMAIGAGALLGLALIRLIRGRRR